MPSQETTRVGCTRCGWRGRRLSKMQLGIDCCEGTHCTHPSFGYCPRCPGDAHAYPMDMIKYWKEHP